MQPATGHRCPAAAAAPRRHDAGPIHAPRADGRSRSRPVRSTSCPACPAWARRRPRRRSGRRRTPPPPPRRSRSPRRRRPWPDTLEADAPDVEPRRRRRSGDEAAARRKPGPRTPQDRAALIGLGLVVLSLVLLELGLTVGFDARVLLVASSRCGRRSPRSACVLGARPGLRGVLPRRQPRSPSGPAWRIAAGGLVGLAVFWLLVVLPVVASDRGFVLTAALAALGAALWIGPRPQGLTGAAQTGRIRLAGRRELSRRLARRRGRRLVLVLVVSARVDSVVVGRAARRSAPRAASAGSVAAAPSGGVGRSPCTRPRSPRRCELSPADEPRRSTTGHRRARSPWRWRLPRPRR